MKKTNPKQKEKKATAEADLNEVRCPIHQKILRFAEQSEAEISIYMPNCCDVEKADHVCFDEYKDEQPSENQSKIIWFKDQEY